MLGKIVSLAVLAIGALVCYMAKLLCKKVLKKEPDDKTVVQIKLVGFGIAVLGLVLLFVIGGIRL